MKSFTLAGKFQIYYLVRKTKGHVASDGAMQDRNLSLAKQITSLKNKVKEIFHLSSYVPDLILVRKIKVTWLQTH